ncbi:MAG: DUF4468 domain-containing protein [Prevotella sp.]|jgi:flavin reductase (DIM6/NTAB) family NADH-FMN oxidoreductase RutF|nr:DUF4468 domain-containing protein [Prevotella sp.]
MNKFFLISLCAIIPVLAYAQENAKYLAGAAPEIDGKVVFSKSITVKDPVSEADLFNLMDKWANDNYVAGSHKDLDNRVLLSNRERKEIACQGEKFLVFKKSAFVLDQAKLTYRLVLNIREGKCEATVRYIKYEYSDSKTPLTAEEMITDKIALNKKGDKLNGYYAKFRRQTIDTVNNIFNSIDKYLNGTVTGGAVAATQSVIAQTPPQTIQPALSAQPVRQDVVATAAVQGAVMNGFRQATADKIPGNYIKLLSDWTLITSGATSRTNVMTASWGGIGTFREKPVAFCFLNPTRYSVEVMDNDEYYTISFYTEAYKDALRYCGSVSGRTTDKIKGSGLTPIKTPSGSTAFAEAWMILECKKMLSQQLSADTAVDKNLPNDRTKDGYHKMYIGEILNVWIK